MDAKELRIGNYVKGIGHKISWLVEGIESEYIYSSKAWRLLNSFEGIPLTQEWLLKFGFFKHEGWFKKGNIVLHPVNNEYYRTGTHYGREMCTVKIEHVHSLQNLYFALTGEELTLKNK